MHVGDVMALAPTAIACDPLEKAMHDLAVDYYHQTGIKSLPLPEVRGCV